jgi:hypothetical protein
MSYLEIGNLYKSRDVLMFQEVYAMEKVHGSSAHVTFKDGKVSFAAGGAKHENFVALFDEKALTDKFQAVFPFEPKHGNFPTVIVYGEAYGGKIQGMSKTYGKDLGFIVFDVKVEETWLNVINAEDVANKLGLEFVPYAKIRGTVDAINAERDKMSVLAERRGMGADKMREGIVIRPLIELTRSNGARVIAKHKREEFAETKTPRVITEADLKILADAEAIAEEWVTPMRLSHILDAFQNPQIENTGEVIKAMWADVEKEAKGEIVFSKEARTAVSRKTSLMFRARVTQVPTE